MNNYCYKSSNQIIGPCGPCSFINLAGLKGSPKLEKELQEVGRLKPFYASDFTSFLAWAQKYKLKVKIYTSKKELPQNTFKMMYQYEKIPKNKQKKAKEQCLKRRNALLKKFKTSVFKLTNNPLTKIDELLGKGYIVAFRIAIDLEKNGFLSGHIRVAYNKQNKKYMIKDSELGLLTISKKDMQRDLINAQKLDGLMEIVALKK